jgi:hypothetical protein
MVVSKISRINPASLINDQVIEISGGDAREICVYYQSAVDYFQELAILHGNDNSRSVR